MTLSMNTTRKKRPVAGHHSQGSGKVGYVAAASGGRLSDQVADHNGGFARAASR